MFYVVIFVYSRFSIRIRHSWHSGQFSFFIRESRFLGHRLFTLRLGGLFSTEKRPTTHAAHERTNDSSTHAQRRLVQLRQQFHTKLPSAAFCVRCESRAAIPRRFPESSARKRPPEIRFADRTAQSETVAVIDDAKLESATELGDTRLED